MSENENVGKQIEQTEPSATGAYTGPTSGGLPEVKNEADDTPDSADEKEKVEDSGDQGQAVA